MSQKFHLLIIIINFKTNIANKIKIPHDVYSIINHLNNSSKPNQFKDKPHDNITCVFIKTFKKYSIIH